MRLWLVVDVWGTGSERGEDGEYHHWDTFRRSRRGGRRGGSLDRSDGFVVGWYISVARMSTHDIVWSFSFYSETEPCMPWSVAIGLVE
jgi:hypothetical protein